ncbi:MAG: discoidin domain-containing protein, partial [Cyclobacteriaceae bacterium]|nr:discoidin domain-containing protein [Cyclobacteriaceae bacterium]
WQTLAAETTIGYKRILRLETVTAEKVRFTIVKSRACPVISNIQLFHAPRVLVPPVIKRDKSGAITLEVPDEEVDVYYILDDGSTYVMDAIEYEGSFVPQHTGLLGAISKDPETGEQSQVAQMWVDIPRKDWKVVSVSSGNLEEAGKMIDEDPSTFWATGEEGVWPREVVIDLGGEYEVRGITYLPAQERYPAGFIQEYEIHVGREENGVYRKVAGGEFSNILNNPTLREISFDRVRCKYIKFRAVKPIEGHTRAGFAEVGVLTGMGGS